MNCEAMRVALVGCEQPRCKYDLHKFYLHDSPGMPSGFSEDALLEILPAIVQFVQREVRSCGGWA